MRTESTARRIVIACGGTGGHVFPGLATGAVLRERGCEVEIWLAGRDVEAHTIAGWEGPVFRTGARPLRPAAFGAFMASVQRCRRQLAAGRTDALLAMGSYSSLPPVLAARLQRVPVVLHEANAVPGRAVAALSRLAAATAVSFQETTGRLRAARPLLTGLPVRPELRDRPPLGGFRQAAGFTVLVTGGSQGAHALNLLCSEAFCRLAASGRMPDLRVIHLTGSADAGAAAHAYRDAGVDAVVHAFLADMGAAFAAADLVICRAGAATCFETCLCGVPAALVPLPSAARDHQRANAAALVAAGGADLLEQKDLTPAKLAGYIETVRADAARRRTMRSRLKSLAMPDAAARLADVVAGVCR